MPWMQPIALGKGNKKKTKKELCFCLTPILPLPFVLLKMDLDCNSLLKAGDRKIEPSYFVTLEV